MRTFLWTIFCALVASNYAIFYTIQQTPMNTTYATTRQFTIQINQSVNQPAFQANINFNRYNTTANTTIISIDVHATTSNVTYSNNTLMFYLPDSVKFNTSDEFYITFDVGVLYSNTSNSSASNDTQFWHLKVVDPPTTTTVSLNTSTVTTTTSSQTTQTSTTTTSSTSAANNSTTSNPSSTSTIGVKSTAGEPPPTRSAQLGMGLGITFITVLIVGEIIYFKYCYTASGRSGNYQT